MMMYSIFSIQIRKTVALALLYGGGYAVLPARAGSGIVGMAEWDGRVLYRTAGGTVFLKWPNDYLAVAGVTR
jgi:hypothetical protein